MPVWTRRLALAAAFIIAAAIAGSASAQTKLKWAHVYEIGEPDHTEALWAADEIKKRTEEETIVSDLTYDLRSGNPDFVDKMVASTFAGMAVDCIDAGQHGVMMAITGGCYDAVKIPDPKLGPRKVEIETMYNVERYRPNYKNKLGLPIFLTRA